MDRKQRKEMYEKINELRLEKISLYYLALQDNDVTLSLIALNHCKLINEEIYEIRIQRK
jgi:hypothetical protein